MNYKIAFLRQDFAINEIAHSKWEDAAVVTVDKYWSGETAPASRHFEARLLWSETAIYVRFDANQDEPLIVSDEPNLATKTVGLWDRDVCEIFLAPNPAEFRKYFEFEVAPTGEWIDLGVRQMPDKRETDWDYASGMKTKSVIGDGLVTMAMKIEWSAFGRTPKAGEKWLGNIFRCVGKDPTRGYLAWSPTLTPEPAFHVPEKFGEFIFT